MPPVRHAKITGPHAEMLPQLTSASQHPSSYPIPAIASQKRGRSAAQQEGAPVLLQYAVRVASHETKFPPHWKMLPQSRPVGRQPPGKPIPSSTSQKISPLPQQ